MDWLAAKLNVASFDDWYKVKRDDVLSHTGLLNGKYGGSLHMLLKNVYPEHEWLPWRFGQVSKGYWDNVQNQRQYFEWLQKKMNISSMEDWYSINGKMVRDQFGGGILAKHDDSIINALMTAFPEYSWQPWRFVNVSKGYWTDLQNQRKYMDWLSQKLGIKEYRDWYRVTMEQVKEQGHGGFLRLHNYSLITALKQIYPEHNWEPWRFQQAPKGYWDDKGNATQYLDTLREQLGIENLNDWKTITTRHLMTMKGGKLIQKSGGLIPMLMKFYPHHNWTNTMSTHPSKQQLLLYRSVKKLFPGLQVHLEHTLKDLEYSRTRKPMVLDVFVPDLSLAFEYQGVQHYNSHFLYGGSEYQQARDNEKRITCMQKNIHLIEVPYWWDGRSSSLQATIHARLPHALPQGDGELIPSESPARVQRSRAIPFVLDVLEFPLKYWEEKEDPTGWWMTSVSLGLRTYWDGFGSMWLVNGKRVEMPDQIVKLLPKEPLDGFLTLDNVENQEANLRNVLSACRSSTSAHWSNIHFHVYEVPSRHSLKMEVRIAKLKQIVPSEGKFLRLGRWTVCNGKDHLLQEVNQGNKLWLRKPGSYYHDNSSFMRAQRVYEEEVLVTSYDRNQITCKIIHNTKIHEFTMAAPSAVQTGSVITIKFEKWVSELPVKPSLQCVRPDLTWQDVVQIASPQSYIVTTGKPLGPTPRCRGCKKQLRSRTDLRLQLKAIFYPPNSGPYNGRLNFCLNTACLQLASERYLASGLIMPPFDGRVLVVTDRKPSELPTVKGIQWIS